LHKLENYQKHFSKEKMSQKNWQKQNIFPKYFFQIMKKFQNLQFGTVEE